MTRQTWYAWGFIGLLVGGGPGWAADPPLEPSLAQAPTGAPLERGADGDGSMGRDQGIDYLPSDQSSQEKETPTFREPRDADTSVRPVMVPRDESGPGHGGNETDMEHRHRPVLPRD